MKRLLALLLAAAMLALTACGSPQKAADPQADQSDTIYVESMDTIMNLTAFGSNRTEALAAAEKEILRLNDLLSVGVETSEVSAVNRDGSGTLSPDPAAMVSRAMELYEETGGAFDITVFPLMELWGFTTQNYHVPTDAELADAMSRVGADRLTFDAGTGAITLDEGQAIDLGGIAKGFTSQRIMEIFRDSGIVSGMVSLGGNVQCLGTKPNGSPWRIGIQDPFGTSGAIAAVVEVADRCVITSGGYERFFEEDGVTYQHILDPATGCPSRQDLASVSIVSADGMLADGLSTALYILGLEQATAYWRSHSDAFDAIFIDTDGTIYVTEGLKDSVTSSAGLTVLPLKG